MLEVLAVRALSKTIGKIATQKGLSPKKYKLILVGLWLGLEITGVVIGLMLFEDRLQVYMLALLGAAIGGFASYQIVKSAKSALAFEEEEVLDGDMVK